MEIMSDCESIKTEDFAVKFTEMSNTECKDSGFSCTKSERYLTPTLTNDDDNEQKITQLDLNFNDEGIESQLNGQISKPIKSKLENSTKLPNKSSSIVKSTPTIYTNNHTSQYHQQQQQQHRRPPVCKYKSLDLESIATEYFEEQFRNLFQQRTNDNDDNNNNNNNNNGQQNSGRSLPTESCTTSLNIDMGNLSNVPPIRRDILNKFLAKYTVDTPNPSYPRPEDHMTVKSHQPIIAPVNYPINEPLGSNVMISRQTNFSPTHESTRKYGALYKNKTGLAEEIRAKSLRIQEEIHEERKRKSEQLPVETTKIDTLDPMTPREKLDVKVRELDQLTERMKKARCDREKITQELTNLRNNVISNSIGSNNPIKINQSNFIQHKSLRNSDSDTTTQRDTSTTPTPKQQQQQHYQIQQHQQQIPRLNGYYTNESALEISLNQKLNEKKSQLKEIEMKICERLKEIRNLESIGLNKAEIEQVIEERNELYEMLRKSEENSHSKYELEKELSNTREQLNYEQKKWNDQILDLEQQLNTAYKKFNTVFEEKEEIIKENESLNECLKYRDEEINKMHLERNELRTLVDRCREEIENERTTSQEMLDRERNRMESHIETQESQNKLKINEFQHKYSQTQMELKNSQEQIAHLKHDLNKLEKEKEQLTKSLKNQENMHRESIQKVKDEYNNTVETLKKDFFTKKETEIQSLKVEYDTEQMKTINNMRDCYKQQVLDLQTRLETKSQEYQDLRNEIRKLKHDYSEREEELKQNHDYVTSQIRKEQQRIVDGMERNKTREIDEMREHFDDLIKKTRSELDKERSLNETLRGAVDKANKDLTKEIENTKRQKQEKNSSLHKLKEIAKEKFQQESKKIREHYEKELEDQLKSMEAVMEEKYKELTKTTTELQRSIQDNEILRTKLQDLTTEFLQICKEQCNEMAKNGKFVSPSFTGIKYDDEADVSNIISNLRKNLQLCCQEFQQYFQDNLNKIKTDNETSVKRIETKNQEDFDAIKEQILKDHADEINLLKYNHNKEIENIQKEHEENMCKLKSGIRDWKTKTAEKLAHKLNKEFRKEIERKTSARDGKTSSSSIYSARQDYPTHQITANQNGAHNPIGLIEDLRANIRQLREENITLRKGIVEKSNKSTDEIAYGNKSRSSSYHSNGYHGNTHGYHNNQQINNNNGYISPRIQNEEQHLGINNGRPRSACHDNYFSNQRPLSRNNSALSATIPIPGNSRSNSFKC